MELQNYTTQIGTQEHQYYTISRRDAVFLRSGCCVGSMSWLLMGICSTSAIVSAIMFASAFSALMSQNDCWINDRTQKRGQRSHRQFVYYVCLRPLQVVTYYCLDMCHSHPVQIRGLPLGPLGNVPLFSFFFCLRAYYPVTQNDKVKHQPYFVRFWKEFWDMHLIPSLTLPNAKVCIDKRQCGDAKLNKWRC